MSELIKVTTVDGVQQIIMQRSEKKNALTKAMYTSMADALQAAAEDSSIRVSLIRGEKGVFTAGNDLADFASGDLGEGDEPPVFRFLKLIATYEKPLMAAVEGPAVGLGTTMLLHCDYVVCAEGTRFSMPFVNLGLCPEAGSSYLLPKIMGHQRAAELLMFGDPFTAATAYDYGIVNAVVSSTELYDTAFSKAALLATKPPASVRLTKDFLKRAEKKLLLETIAEEGATFTKRLASAEAKEAFSAFLAKRKPDFSSFE